MSQKTLSKRVKETRIDFHCEEIKSVVFPSSFLKFYNINLYDGTINVTKRQLDLPEGFSATLRLFQKKLSVVLVKLS